MVYRVEIYMMSTGGVAVWVDMRCVSMGCRVTSCVAALLLTPLDEVYRRGDREKKVDET